MPEPSMWLQQHTESESGVQLCGAVVGRPPQQQPSGWQPPGPSSATHLPTGTRLFYFPSKEYGGAYRDEEKPQGSTASKAPPSTIQEVISCE